MILIARLNITIRLFILNQRLTFNSNPVLNDVLSVATPSTETPALNVAMSSRPYNGVFAAIAKPNLFVIDVLIIFLGSYSN